MLSRNHAAHNLPSLQQTKHDQEIWYMPQTLVVKSSQVDQTKLNVYEWYEEI